MSRLTVGTGKVARNKRSERLELHFNHREYNNIVKARTRPRGMYVVGRETKAIPKVVKTPSNASRVSSLRSFEASLPKTYLTRSGSMLLYSDRKIMKENDRQCPPHNRLGDFDITGQAIPRPGTSASNAKWMQLLGKKTNPPGSWSVKSDSCRENGRYIKSRASDRSHESGTLPYSWNYAVSPARLIHPSTVKDIKTVKGLSDAVLAYRNHEREDIEDNDTSKYLDLIRRKWDSRTNIEKQQLILSGKTFTVSDWTRDWINVHRVYLRDAGKQEDFPPVSAPKKIVHHVHKRRRQPKCAWEDETEKLSRVPTNTPHSRSRRAQSRNSRVKGITV